MLHADRPKRVKNVRKAQAQPGEQIDEEHIPAGAPTPHKATEGNSAADLEALPDIVCNQDEFDECVSEWLYACFAPCLKSTPLAPSQRGGIFSRLLWLQLLVRH